MAETELFVDRGDPPGSAQVKVKSRHFVSECITNAATINEVDTTVVF